MSHRTLSRINLASAQNNVAIVEEIAIENSTSQSVSDITVVLRSTPPIIHETTWRVDTVAPGSRVVLGDTSVQLERSILRSLNEAETGEFEFRMEGVGFSPVVRRHPVELLARDEWGGLGEMAQLLGAFVAPNDPAVERVLKDASLLLERAGYSSSMDGYQSGEPHRAYMIAGSIWSAMTGLGLTYAKPTASFEIAGQKVRGPDRIVSYGIVTCLDSTLFLAAALEAAGLNPVVLFSTGHAFLGVWLIPRDFGHVTEPDVVAVRKAVQVHELVPIETTLLTSRPAVGFERAVEVGRHGLTEERDPDFRLAVDITRSRAARIRPLASQETPESPMPEDSDETNPAELPPLPDFQLLYGEIGDEESRSPGDRIDRWQRKLLDLSLRNRLLNFGDSKRTLPIRCPNVAQLEDELASGREFQGFSWNDNDPIGNRTLPPIELQSVERAVLRDAFERGEVVVPLTGKEMNNRLLKLYRSSRSDIQEGGTNTLYLASGFLKWRREGDSRVYRAPLLLVPIKLGRRSAHSRFRISHHEDDVRFNSTLLEFLSREFNLRIAELEDALPRDDNGINVPLIFQLVRHKVRDFAGLEVVEELALSTFCFAKYLMWKDMVERAEQLRQNRLVAHLIAGPEEGDDKRYGSGAHAARTEPKEIDRRPPLEFLTPLPADSSQLAAVLDASEGRDFILVGPPGTGKSQTIANIISQCLGQGKTVLFVAEKAAALDVVYRRLAAVGLGDAVLELHSNKTDRGKVVSQLGRAWDRAAVVSDEKWNEVNAKLEGSRDELNAYVEAVHAKGTQGFSVYDAVARTSEFDQSFKVAFDSKDVHDERGYKELVDLAADLGRMYSEVGSGTSLSLVHHTEFSHSWQSELLRSIETLRAGLAELLNAAGTLNHQLGLRPDHDLVAGRRTRLKALAPRLDTTALDISRILDLPADRLKELAESFLEDCRSFAAAVSAADASYSIDEVRRMPLDRLDADWRDAQVKIWPLAAHSERMVKKRLQTYATSGEADPSKDLRALFRMRKHDAAIQENPLASIAGSGGDMDLDRISEVVHQAVAFKGTAADLETDAEDPERFGNAVSELASGDGGPVADALKAYLAAERDVAAGIEQFNQCGGVHPADVSVIDFDAGLADIANEQARLGDWVKWVQACKAGRKLGLGPLVDALEDGHVAAGDAAEAFEGAYSTWWLPLAMDAVKELREFARFEHEHIVDTFRRLDDAATQLAPAEVKRRIAHGLPERSAVSRRSELGILRHQLNLSRPSMPIRQLLGNLPESFGKLVPCVLMSPLSIAQYLPTNQSVFDLVIFDEASQITPWDAIGAIARASQTIVVGDPKQLPPTNFFGRADDYDEDLPEVERDMPSILDEVAAAGMPTRSLNWHYRSRDEALISYSNHLYYGGRLVTFPAPTTDPRAIGFHKVVGIYARGGGRINQVEAKAVADMVQECLSTWIALPETERPTLGVITFNAQQQSLILDLLDEVRRHNDELEWFFAEEREEPVIVKNLENIQGDERDVMLLSVTFGPDLAGKITMNFGPINGSGGEKRLNVAITRARRELHVFASIRADQIDLERTRSIGVRHLKGFLDYAERGPVAIPALDEGSLEGAANPFEGAIAEAMRAKGWEVRTQIGVSGFRIDLGIVHPDRTGSYLVGLECDGATYHSSATARDRDKLRQAVLEGLGWTILRIWSTDWFRSPVHVAERVHRELEEILERDRQRRSQSEFHVDSQSKNGRSAHAHAVPAQSEVPIPTGLAGNEDRSTNPENGSPSSDCLPDPPQDSAQPDVSGSEKSEESSPAPVNPISNDHSASCPSSHIGGMDASIGKNDTFADPDRFFDPDYLPSLQSIVWRIVDDEGPLTLRRLNRMVAEEHGWKRVGKRIRAQVERVLLTVDCRQEFGTEFVWRQGSYSDRIAFRGLGGRQIWEVSRSEICSVIDQYEQELAAEDDRISALARRLGILRLSGDMRSHLANCMHWREETAAGMPE